MRLLLFLAFPLICASYEYYAPGVAERFPLAGGLRHGMEVTVSVQGYADENSKFEFVNAAGEAVFKFTLDRNMSMIKRVLADGTTREFGGWPLGANSASHSFKFVVSGKRLMTFIDGVFSPWFDCDDMGSASATHLWVFSGFKDVLVNIQMPTCKNTWCDADECTDGFGRHLCKTENGSDSTDCTVKVESKGVPTACYRADQTADSSSSCCVGTSTPLSPAAVDSWQYFEVVGDESRISRGCQAFGIDPCPFKRWQKFHCSHFNTDGTTLCVWKNQNDQMVPLSILKPITVYSFNYTLNGDQMKATKLEYGWDYETFVTESSVGGLEGLYVYVMHQRGKQLYEDPWVYVIKDRYDYWTAPGCTGCKPGVNLLATTIPNPIAVQCQDLVPAGEELWVDKKGRSCADYVTANVTLCDQQGQPGPDWTDGDSLYDNSVVNFGWGSPVACCSCGGGSLGGSRTAFPEYMNDLNVLKK